MAQKASQLPKAQELRFIAEAGCSHFSPCPSFYQLTPDQSLTSLCSSKLSSWKVSPRGDTYTTETGHCYKLGSVPQKLVVKRHQRAQPTYLPDKMAQTEEAADPGLSRLIPRVYKLGFWGQGP